MARDVDDDVIDDVAGDITNDVEMTAHFRTGLGHFLPTVKSKLTKQVH